MDAKQIYININVEIMRARQAELGLTPKEFAKRVGVSRRAITHWYTHTHKPSPRYYSKICEVLDCELPDICDLVTARYVYRLRKHIKDTIENKEYSDIKKANFLRDMWAVYIQTDAWMQENEEVKGRGSKTFTDWRNPDLYAFESSSALDVVNYEDTLPLIVSGPTRCGKTLRILEMVMGLHFQNKGFRSLILRANAVDLGETIRRDIRDVLIKFPLDDPLSHVKADGLGGSRNFKSLKINDGEMVLGGMNRPGRILGTSYNLIYASQVEQFTEEQFNMLMTRCAGDCPGWYDDDGIPRGLFIGDANPDDAEHWVKQYEADGRLKLINFGFDDNPLFFRKGKRTAVGESVITQLDTSLSGIYHDRFFKGLWCNVEGRVFDIKDEHYLDEGMIQTDDYIWHRACDFGISAPSVCLWIGVNKKTGGFYVHREFRKTGTDTIELCNEIKKYSKEPVMHTIIDNDEDKQKLFKRQGILSTMTKKTPHSIEDGIHLIQDAMRKSTEGVEGGLYFNRSLRCNVDASLVRDKKPLSVLDEMKTYIVNPDTDKPDGSDHGIDALRYFMLWHISRKAPVGFGTRTAKRKQRV